MELVSNASGMNLANYALTEKAKHEHAQLLKKWCLVKKCA